MIDISPTQIIVAIGHGLWHSRFHLFRLYVVVPFGIIILLAILYGFNVLLADIAKVKFPALVLGMLINLVFLCVLSLLTTVKSAQVRSYATWTLNNYLRIIKPSMNFTLVWINMCFIPAFIMLPLLDHITIIECLKIAAVFIVGLVALLAVDVYLIVGFKWILDRFGLYKNDLEQKKESDTESIKGSHSPKGFTTTVDNDITTIDLQSLKSHESRTRGLPYAGAAAHFSGSESPENGDVSGTATPYSGPFGDRQRIDQNRGTFGQGQRSRVGSFEEDQRSQLGSENEDSRVPSRGSFGEYGHPSLPERAYTPNVKSYGDIGTPVTYSAARVPLVSGSELEMEIMEPSVSQVHEEEEEDSALNDKQQQIALFVTEYIDWILYTTLFVVLIPFYYIKSIHTFLPYHLGLTVLSYRLALLVPQKWPRTKKFAHPILTCTAEILFVCFIGLLIFHHGQPKGFLEDLKFYKTGKTYLNLFDGKIHLNGGKETHLQADNYTATPKWPGCGDFLTSMMDVSIVALSLPMFTHRADFLRNFWILMPPIIVSIGLTFFLYPIVCHNIGIEATRAIGFIGRSATLALGTPLVIALDGNLALTSVCTVLSGILLVLVGDYFFKLLRVPLNDYLTRGVTLGINGGAIGTASLLHTNPRAALMSSLSFLVFGTVMVIMASIGPIRLLIRLLVGL